MNRIYTIIAMITILLTNPAAAFFDQLFGQHRQQQQQQQQKRTHQQEYFSRNCDKYLCPDTLECVDIPANCPCPFPDSQIKCVIPKPSDSLDSESSFVCISKGGRDCQFILDAYNGVI